MPFIYNYRVVRSDLDSNNHANWSVYVKYSLDAIYHFSNTGFLASFSDFDSFFFESYGFDVLRWKFWR